VLRHLVRERTGDGAGGHERIDGGERDPSRLLGGHERVAADNDRRARRCAFCVSPLTGAA
jgi:hypothetical protein